MQTKAKKNILISDQSVVLTSIHANCKDDFMNIL